MNKPKCNYCLTNWYLESELTEIVKQLKKYRAPYEIKPNPREKGKFAVFTPGNCITKK